MKLCVKDSKLKGSGFVDSLSNTWQKVKTFVFGSPLAQKVVKDGLPTSALRELNMVRDGNKRLGSSTSSARSLLFD